MDEMVPTGIDPERTLTATAPLTDVGLAMAEDMVKRAAAFQAEADRAGYGRPSPAGVTTRLHATGLAATLSIEVAVVRSAKPRRCSVCGLRRVLFALTVTDSAIANADVVWRCAPDAGLRP